MLYKTDAWYTRYVCYIKQTPGTLGRLLKQTVIMVIIIHLMEILSSDWLIGV